MEMEMEVSMESMMERLQAAAGALEVAADRLAAVEIEASATRESELVERLAAAEETIAGLRAQMAAQPVVHAGRKTIAAGALAVKEGMAPELQGGSLDAALGSLSIEQRIAVKAGLLRSGLLG